MSERKVTLEDVAREYLREQGCDLRDQLFLSHFIARAKQALGDLPEIEVVDREKGLRLIK